MTTFRRVINFQTTVWFFGPSCTCIYQKSPHSTNNAKLANNQWRTHDFTMEGFSERAESGMGFWGGSSWPTPTS